MKLESTLRAALAVIAVATLAAPAQAQTFVTADISINSVGFLDCSFKESGLDAGSQVTHSCTATDVGWLTQCFVKSKSVSPAVLHIAKDLQTQQTRTASGRGTITAAVLTAYPTVEEVGPEPCSEPAVEKVTAIRWCNASLSDVTHSIVAATAPELFLQMERAGSGSVPSCDQLATMPPIP